MGTFLLRSLLLWTVFRCSDMQASPPDTALNCCEGDLLLLLDSSGSVTKFEFSLLLQFVADLLSPFSLGRGHVRAGLLQVGTNPNLEFGLDVHGSQESLQSALRRVHQLQGDTNTEAALRLAQQILREAEEEKTPKILLWLTDGVQPGDVDELMTELKAQGVYVLAVSTVHGNFQVLQRAVTPPHESHLYLVDLEKIEIITEELRETIIEILRAERLRVVHLTSHSAVLQWRPVLTAGSGHYELKYKSVQPTDPQRRRILPGDSSQVELTNLQPDTLYSASLQPESNQRLFKTLSVSFTTLPDVLGPSVVSLSDSGPRQVRVSWGPLQPSRVRKYTVEYGAIPSGRVSTVTFSSHQNSTLLTDLQPDTQYLITVSALHVSGQERAMSVRACTPEGPKPALVDLQVTPAERQEVKLTWRAHEEGLRGYWLSWERETPNRFPSGPFISSVYLPPHSRETRLTQTAANSRVCVSPIYSSGRGDGICCTADTHTDSRQSG